MKRASSVEKRDCSAAICSAESSEDGGIPWANIEDGGDAVLLLEVAGIEEVMTSYVWTLFAKWIQEERERQ